MKHFNPKLTKSTSALIAVGKHLQTKDGDPFDILAKKFGDHTAEAMKRISETEESVKGVVEHLNNLEQNLARSNSSSGITAEEKTWGGLVEQSEAYKSFQDADSRHARMNFGFKGTLTGSATSAGPLANPAYRDAPSALPPRRLTVRGLLPVIQIDSGSADFAHQTRRINNAAPAAETAKKAESDYAWALKNVPTRVIAHFVKASRQVVSDAPQMRGIIDTELLYGLALAEENQLLNGDGSGENLNGLIPEATAFSAPITVASPTMIDNLGLAILQNALADYPATGIVIHPSDWMRMRLLKDGDGKYLLGDPQSNVSPNLFGLPVVATQAMAVDKFLVGDFQSAATVYDRWEARVEAGYENDDFTKNMITLLAEERLAQAVKRGEALTYGDFGNEA